MGKNDDYIKKKELLTVLRQMARAAKENCKEGDEMIGMAVNTLFTVGERFELNLFSDTEHVADFLLRTQAEEAESTDE